MVTDQDKLQGIEQYAVRCAKCDDLVSVGIENFTGCICSHCKEEMRKGCVAQFEMEILICNSELRRWKKKLKKAKKGFEKYSQPTEQDKF